VLRFVYTDETPPDVRNLLDTDCSTAADKARLTGRVRDLLAVADRFGLERVRLMCERVLCEAMDEENAAAALSLADRHHCQKLKAFLHPLHLFYSRRVEECDGDGSFPGAQGEPPFYPHRAPTQACYQGNVPLMISSY
jgi:hypothetical protein